MSNALIQIKDISKTFSEPKVSKTSYVLKDVNLNVRKGEFFILLGPSGCGKSTLLNMIAGFIQATDGQLIANNQEVIKPGEDRGMMFQQADSSLFPWLTVKENVEFGLRMKKIEKSERNKISKHYIDLVNLSGHEHKFPRELSGGMKQRVQLARVLANNPDILLMDEPFGALDAMTRKVMQQELIRVWKQTNKTIVFVTHDLQEALLLGQKIGIMSVGPDSKITHYYDVNLEYPRDITTSKFNEIYANIQQHFEH